MELFPITRIIQLPPLQCFVWDKSHLVNSLAATWACLIPPQPFLGALVVMVIYFLLAGVWWYGLRNNLIRYIPIVLLTFGSLFYQWQWGGYGSNLWGIRFNNYNDPLGFCLYDFLTSCVLITYWFIRNYFRSWISSTAAILLISATWILGPVFSLYTWYLIYQPQWKPFNKNKDRFIFRLIYIFIGVVILSLSYSYLKTLFSYPINPSDAIWESMYGIPGRVFVITNLNFLLIIVSAIFLRYWYDHRSCWLTYIGMIFLFFSISIYLSIAIVFFMFIEVFTLESFHLDKKNISKNIVEN